MEAITDYMQVSTMPGANRDYYNVKNDCIFTKGSCPMVFLHEVAHATGHPTRLNRRGIREYLTLAPSSRSSREAKIEEMIAQSSAYALMFMLDIPVTAEMSAKHENYLAQYVTSDVQYDVEVLKEVERVLEYLRPLTPTITKGE